MFAILGSGFGLYGYLPALAAIGVDAILLPERYREQFSARPELSGFAKHIYWDTDASAIIRRAEGAVLAIRPADQTKWVSECIGNENLRYLLLEKPLAETPEIAARLQDQLLRSGKAFRIGYTFAYTDWAERLVTTLKHLHPSGTLSITWRFMAHHYAHNLKNWKRFHESGGGAIRFYGIHVIALLAKLGYRTVEQTTITVGNIGELASWQSVFSGHNLPDCTVKIDSASHESSFNVELVQASDQPRMSLAAGADPFTCDNNGAGVTGVDDRVRILSRLCHSLTDTTQSEYEWYAATIVLWQAVEDDARLH